MSVASASLSYFCVLYVRSEVVNKEIGEVKIIIPPTRGDIIHACDIIEDVAIAYGFNNIIKTFPLSVTVGSQQVSMKLSERLRIELAAAGFTEALTFSLCAEADIGKKMRQSQDKVDKLAVRIANPKTLDFQVSKTIKYENFIYNMMLFSYFALKFNFLGQVLIYDLI